MRTKILKTSLLILMMSLIGLTMTLVVAVSPQDKGAYCLKDYEEYLRFGYESEKQYGEVHNIYDACWIATDAVAEKLPESRLSILSTEYRRQVYYDGESNTWFVYFSLYDPKVLGGEYGCIISSSGEVISCWGWK